MLAADPYSTAGGLLAVAVVLALALFVPSRRVHLGLALAAGMGLRLWVALQDPLLLQSWPLSDDSHYYFTIARNLAEGHGLRHDSFHTTTGFQPLFLVLVVPIFWVIESPTGAVTAVLLFQCLLGLALCGALYRLASLVGGARAGVLAVAIWALSPTFLSADLNGLETGLALLALTLVFDQYLRHFVLGEPSTSRDWALFGALLGLAYLARVDCGLVAPFVWLDALRRTRARTGSVPREALLTPLLALIVASPWMLLNLVLAGSVLPTSGQAVRFLSQAYGFEFMPDYGPDGPLPDGHLPAAFYVGTVATALRELRIVVNWTLPLWGAAFFLALALMASRRVLRRFLSDHGAIIAAYSALFAAYSFYIFGHWFLPRYLTNFALPYLLLLAVVVTGLPDLSGDSKRPQRLAAVGVLALSLGTLTFNSLQLIEKQARVERPSSYWVAAQWANENTPEDAVLGVFQTGIFGYFVERSFYGLDGKINRDALVAMKERRIDAYVREQQIDYLMDWPWILQDLYTQRSEDPTLLERTPRLWEGAFHVYRLQPEEAMNLD